ncbi:MAG: hypothetical protein Kow0092_31930 [Deferrisomatales bacterium]
MRRRLATAGGLLLGLSALLQGCGADGTSVALGDPPGGGIGGTGKVAVVAEGPISEFGSIVVNGIEFDVSGARILREGDEIAEDGLRLGMVVQVSGTYDPSGPPTAGGFVAGQAERVDYADEVEGPVVVDPATGELSVLGRAIVLSAATHMEGMDGGPMHGAMHGLLEGDVVEVSGLVGPDGRIRATYVERKHRAEEFDPERHTVELRGVVAELTEETFRLDGQPIRFDSRTRIEGELREGARVDVTGHLHGGGEVLADRIESAQASLPEGYDAEVEGIVGTVGSGPVFTLNGLEVDASDAAFEGGAAADLAPGVSVEVEGTVQGGVLVARTVEIERDEED